MRHSPSGVCLRWLFAALWALRILHNRKVVIASAGGTIETSDTGDIDDIGDRSTTANAQNPHSAQRPACSTQSSHGVFTRVLRRPMTWYVTAFMGLQSSAFYTMSNWMPSISASIGYDASTAGVHLFIFQGIGILSGLVIPKLMNVRGNQVCAALTASAPMLIAGLGMLLLPHLMPVWAFVGGCAQGASLVVALARSRCAAVTAPKPWCCRASRKRSGISSRRLDLCCLACLSKPRADGRCR